VGGPRNERERAGGKRGEGESEQEQNARAESNGYVATSLPRAVKSN